MKKYDLYWTPCPTHCIDLMFEDIDKWQNVVHVVSTTKKKTNFINNHGWLFLPKTTMP